MIDVMLRTLDDLDVSGKRVLLRVDFNVVEEGRKVKDDFRVRATLPSIALLKERGARVIVLLSHFGRPQGREDALSTQPVAEHVSKLLGESVRFLADCIGEEVETAVRAAGGGEVLFLENVRFQSGEVLNDPVFAAALARLGDCFVNEAFGAMHRAHASIVLLPALLPSAAGPRVVEEIEVLTRLRDHPKDPFVAVIGGAKIRGKLPLIEHFLPQVSGLCLGGALANTVLKAKGIDVGRSLIEEDMVPSVRDMARSDTRLHLPVDVVVSTKRNGTGPVRTCRVEEVGEEEMILDIGPETGELFSRIISGARTVFWNGPMGLAEVEAFGEGTRAVERAIVASRAFSVVGGGDTTQYPIAMGLEESIDFLSTGGGAMLEFLAGKKLPGLKALTRDTE